MIVPVHIVVRHIVAAAINHLMVLHNAVSYLLVSNDLLKGGG
jgi:hypothetical protein